MYPQWTFVLSTYGGIPVGEIKDAYDRQVIRVLSGSSTAGFRVPVTNAHVPDLLTRDLALKCYRDKKLMFHGPLTTIELAVQDQTQQPTVAVTAADPSWRFVKRIAGKSATGTKWTAATDRVVIAEALITQANSEGETGVLTPGGQVAGNSVTWTAGPYKTLEECIRELSQSLSGFDWYIEPLEYASGKIGRFKAAGTIGSQKDNAVFEYQGRGNMRVPTLQRSLTDSANKVYHIHDAGPAAPDGVRSLTNATSVSRRGLYEAIAEASSLTDATVRDALINEHLAVRAEWRQMLTFSPDYDDYSGRVPAYGVDYQVGDQVRARVSYNDVSLVDGIVRLYKMQFDIDANNRETLTPTVVDEV